MHHLVPLLSDGRLEQPLREACLSKFGLIFGDSPNGVWAPLWMLQPKFKFLMQKIYNNCSGLEMPPPPLFEFLQQFIQVETIWPSSRRFFDPRSCMCKQCTAAPGTQSHGLVIQPTHVPQFNLTSKYTSTPGMWTRAYQDTCIIPLFAREDWDGYNSEMCP